MGHRFEIQGVEYEWRSSDFRLYRYNKALKDYEGIDRANRYATLVGAKIGAAKLDEEIQ